MQKHPLQKDSPSQKMGQGDISAIHNSGIMNIYHLRSFKSVSSFVSVVVWSFS